MKESTDWGILIQKHLDGQTSEEEAASLSDRIVTDAAVRSDYLRAARLHGALGDETLELDREVISFPGPEPRKSRRVLSIAWRRQIVAARLDSEQSCTCLSKH